ncbi:MAG TPA: cytochrome c3 family protein [Desulfuromonadales bacterium]|nr:cytochrome c3 family protein [Desulfuromonadales bacterium]
MKNWNAATMNLLVLVLLFGLAGFAGATDMPETVVLDTLGELYEPVEFDHTLHTELGEDCSICHHHTTGTGPESANCARCHADSPESEVVACSDCHEAEPFAAGVLQAKAEDRMRYHKDKPGLKAVYHLSCMGCHEAWGAPVGCQECHARTPAGDDYYHADAKGDAVTH